MAEIHTQVHQPEPIRQAAVVTIKYKHVVYIWAGLTQGGAFWIFDQTPSGYQNKNFCAGFWNDLTTMLIPIDPLTAIGLGLVTPEELEYPPGILAAFNLLKGH